jgi:hypothetical protein
MFENTKAETALTCSLAKGDINQLIFGKQRAGKPAHFLFFGLSCFAKK